MAVVPLFFADMATLKSNLRLSNIPTGKDALTIIDQAVQEVRVGFYEKLGAATITTLLATVHVDNPTTTAEVSRARANATEVAWVKLLLICRLPIMFVDGSAHVRESWNDEGLTRRALDSELRKIKALLNQQVEDGLAILGADEDEAGLSISVIEPTEGRYYPRSSVFPLLAEES